MFGSVPPSKSSKKSEPPTAIPKTETATCHNLRAARKFELSQCHTRAPGVSCRH